MAEDAIPNIIRAAGEQAVRAYEDFFDDAARNPNTRKLYRWKAGRFFGWAEARGLTLGRIDAAAIGVYGEEIGVATSRHTATVYLTPVRGVLGHLARSSVLAVDPCPKGQPNGRRGLVGFPLLDLLAMLGHMAEPSLSQILNDEAIAQALLQQVRWPEGLVCPHCGAAGDGGTPAEAICPACAKLYSVTTGTMFEGSRVPVRLWLVVMQQMYLVESALSDEELGRRFGLGNPAVVALRQRIGEAVVQKGLPKGGELARARST